MRPPAEGGILLAGYKRLLDAIGVVERLTGITLIALIVVTIFIQVVTRYLFDRPIVWVEELATYAFIWGTFIGASLGLKRGRHIRIETFVAALRPRGAALVRLVAWLFVLTLMVFLVRHGWTVMAMEGRSYSIALPVAIPRMWFYSVPLVVASCSMGLTTLYMILEEVEILRGRRAAPDPALR